jgi:hypothetical protein
MRRPLDSKSDTCVEAKVSGVHNDVAQATRAEGRPGIARTDEGESANDLSGRTRSKTAERDRRFEPDAPRLNPVFSAGRGEGNL